jgi:hypothetical protein
MQKKSARTVLWLVLTGGVDSEYSGRRYPNMEVRNIVGLPVAKTAVKRIPVRGEQAANALKRGHLELFRTLPDHLAI